MSIGTRIKEARLARKLSQAALATKIGVKQPTLSQLETGDSATTIHVVKLAAALGVNALWIDTGKGPRDIELSTSHDPPGVFDLKAESATEMKLLSVYRLANEREREAIDNLVDSMRSLIEGRIREDNKRAG